MAPESHSKFRLDTHNITRKRRTKNENNKSKEKKIEQIRERKKSGNISFLPVETIRREQGRGETHVCHHVRARDD